MGRCFTHGTWCIKLVYHARLEVRFNSKYIYVLALYNIAFSSLEAYAVAQKYTAEGSSNNLKPDMALRSKVKVPEDHSLPDAEMWNELRYTGGRRDDGGEGPGTLHRGSRAEFPIRSTLTLSPTAAHIRVLTLTSMTRFAFRVPCP